MKRLIILVIVLFTAIGAFVVNLPPREMRLKDLHPAYYPLKTPSNTSLSDTAGKDSTGRVDDRISGSGFKPEPAAASTSTTTSNTTSTTTSISPTTHISVLPKLPATAVNSKTKSDSRPVTINEPQSEPQAKSGSKSDSGSEYYIIVESLKTLETATEKAEKLKKKFSTDFLVLPPTKEGYYRISCGKYATLEDARSKINIVKTSIRPDVWIFSSASAVPGSRHD